MLRSLNLLLPALIPSWNFFDSIGPSPRIEYALLQAPEDQQQKWREFRPRPENLSLAVMMGRVFWNPRWNETLFLVSCAERIVDAPTEHSIQEVFQRIQTHLIKSGDSCDCGAVAAIPATIRTPARCADRNRRAVRIPGAPACAGLRVNLESALRLTEILLALAFIQQSLEHLRGERREHTLFLLRIALCLCVIFAVAIPWAILGLALLSLFILQRFQGPYNGGSDRMGLLALWCICAAHFLPEQKWREIAFGYLGIQLVLSYFMAGWVKILNPDWRSGRALQDVFQFSAYPVSEELRRWAERPRILFIASWAVMVFELLFPLSLLSQPTLIAALIFAAAFHLANACLFGLNRFFWTWLAVYPAIVWLQGRIF